ncbi:BnaCnng53480D [Brassica napus]|uniref:BnaCnng53480D protein n=1 Tax=Brassica napus TaxID=3708 RepID=A0A078JHL1_BRANA|nr:BnaCnng53480D [Brassica napus]
MSFRNSFKSHSTYKQIRSPGNQSEASPENRPILHDHDHHLSMAHRKTESSRSSLDDGRNAPLQRDSSYKFWQENTGTSEEPARTSLKDPTTINRQSGTLSDSFNFGSGKPQPPMEEPKSGGEHRQWGGRGEITLDVDQDNDDVSHQTQPTPTSTARSSFDPAKDLRVSFNVQKAGINFVGSVPSSSTTPKSTTPSSCSPRTMRTNQESHQQEEEVVRCTSNRSSFQRKAELVSRTKTRSRLQDPPQEEDTSYSGWRSGQLKSGLLGDIDEEDDPLAEEDIPDEYKKGKLDAITLLEWLSLVAIIAALACSLSIPSWKKVRVWNLHLWKWEVFLLVLICGRLVSGWGIRIVVFFIERNFLLRKRVLYFVYGVRGAVQNCLWLSMVLIAWRYLFDKKVQRETDSNMNHKNISAWNMKRLMKIVRHVSLTTLDEQMQETTNEDESTRQIRSEKEAKAAARKIFTNVARRGSKHIYLDDLMRFLREDEAVKTMYLFEGAPETRKISKSALKNWLVNAFRERRALTLTLNDTKTAVNKLHHMINIVTAIVIAVIWLVLLEIASSKILLFVSSQVVLLAFIFGNTVKTVFESIIFLFIVHPYDVGDRCEIDDVQLVVEEMNILTTVFLRYDNLKIMYPNSLLWQKSISNYYRSPDMTDTIEFCVHITTPHEKIATIRQRISNYIDNKPEYWHPSAKIVVKNVEQLNMVRLVIWPDHRFNFQDILERWARRSVLVEEIIKILLELDIEYRFYPMGINVKAMPTVVSSRVPQGWSYKKIISTQSAGSSLDGNKADMERDSSYTVWQDIGTDDHTQGQKSGSFDFPQYRDEITLDVDEETEDITNTPASGLDASKVSFKINDSSGSVRSRTYSTSFSSATMRMNLDPQDQDEEVVVRCSSMRKTELVSRAKARSRLIDPPQEEEQQYSSWMGTSEQLRSGLLARQSSLEEEDDHSLAEEDVPEEYRRTKMDAITLLQWLSLISVVVLLVLSLGLHSWRDTTLWKLHLWKWEVVFLVLICGRLVSGMGIRIIVFFIERNFLLRKRVLYFVYGVKTAVQNCLWLGLVLIAWHFLFDKKVERETQSDVLLLVTKILTCFLLSTILWLIKTLVVKVLASSFHVSTYFDRIQEALFHHYLIETLSGPPMLELSRIEEEEERAQEEIFKMQKGGADLSPDLYSAAFPPEKNGSVSNSVKTPIIPKTGTDSGITMNDLNRMNQKNVSAWNMKRLIKIVRHVSLTTLDEQALQNTSEDESIRQIRSEKEAKAAARKIFKNVAQRGTKHIYLEDLMRFLRADEAIKTMSLFEGALVTKKITKSALKNWLVNAFRERRALALTLNDTKTAVNKLHHMINFLTAIVIVIIWLVLLEIATSKSLLFLTSQVVLLAFMFGNSLKTVFESIIFLFIIHPYDVGDRLVIDTVEMVVEEMNILTTVFLRADNLKIVYPNILLWQKAIHNYNRSPDMGDEVQCCVHITTPPEKIVAIKQRISSYIDSKPEYWYPKADIIVKDVEDLNIVRLAIWPRHKINHQNMGEKFTRRALLVEEVIKILLELDIQYRFHPLDINVKTMPTVVSSRVPPGWSQNPDIQGN